MDNFTIFKNDKKEKPNQPDYIVSAKTGEGKYETWGACWLKDGQNGKYFSCSKSKPMNKEEDKKSTQEFSRLTSSEDYPESNTSLEDIPF